MTGNDKLDAIPGSSMQPGVVSFPLLVGNYTIGETILGVGNFATVHLGVHNLTGEKVALKLIDKKALGFDEPTRMKMLREIAITKALRHPNVIRTYQTVENEEHVVVVMEYAEGGEMYTQLTQRGRYLEPEASRLFRQIVAAVHYCHSLHVVHRDLKTENLLLDAQGNVKLADFGFSDVMKPGECLVEHCGSPPYAAPELFQGHGYDGQKSDLWSLGVILYVMVAGMLPFDAASFPDMRQLILSGHFQMPSHVSVACASLLRAMLVVDPGQRCDLDYVIRHPWLHFHTSGEEEGSLFRDCSLDDLELNEFVLDEMERLGYARTAVRHCVHTEPCHDVSATYHLLNDKHARLLNSTYTLPTLPSLPIPISQSSSRRSSILTGKVARDEIHVTSTVPFRRSSLPPLTTTIPSKPTLFETFSWPITTHPLKLNPFGRRASDGSVPFTSDYSLSKEMDTLSMADSDEEPDMEAVQRYLSVRGRATRHTVATGRRTTNQSPTGSHLCHCRSPITRRHSDNPQTTTRLKGARMPYRAVSPLDEVTNLQRQLDSGFGSSPASLSPQRQSLCNPPSPQFLTVPTTEVFPARLDAAFRSPTFLEKMYGGIRIRITSDGDEIPDDRKSFSYSNN